jgi:hypothetical protein
MSHKVDKAVIIIKDDTVLIELLLQNLRIARFNIEKTEITSICPFCNGGRSKDKSFYISIPTKEKPRFLYYCHRANCREHGYIKPQFLRMIDADNYEANVYLSKLNKTKFGEKKFKYKDSRYIKNFPSSNTKESKAKVKYLNDRLGLSLELKDLVKLKIHTDMKDLYSKNEVKFPEKKEKYYSLLSDYGLCFVSSYNDYIIVRNATDTEKIKRYTMIDIFEDDIDGDKFKTYNIPTRIDILSPDTIEINLAEGTFDILSVYFNITKGHKDSFNKIFCSVSGSTYEKILTHFIRQYGLLNIVVKIYSDSNVTLTYYESIYKKIRNYVNHIEMHVYYNTVEKEKDFGVSKDRIKIQENTIR